ncbi:MAG: hypothetical protein IPG34_17235 [Rhodocyclaceae bacterium]|nr:hypothetical protein [Rhodocyclaceae bacterium]
MLIKKVVAATLLHIAAFLDRAHLKLDYWAAKLHLAHNSVTARLLESLAINDEFSRSSKSISESLQGHDVELKDGVNVYFLTKQVIALYEAQINYLPLQVYNEMRNALDHYMRAITFSGLTQPNERRRHHINKMTGHLQRALLDVIKLTCAAMVEKN